jgi:signal transduction histidine kinase
MLKKEIGENEKINRIETSVANILNLQNHLRSYLENHSLQKEEFDLKTLIDEQINDIQKSYPDISFSTDLQKNTLFTSRDAFSRVMINILTNAAKYNRANGFVKITYRDNTLHVEDSGKGIRNPKRIFERFYKEQTRGIGIGLHIVKKLCDELHIKIDVKSRVGEGTTFMLNLSKLI